ncbi:2765_t:CDS:2 [Diversispora eburnea]|uniref:2765_t:CDS:1 n=1 Tax=Diversispora eburnea TaxID=1213867 RepID=A0A9N9FJB1_9GLOM|nr:2765_t:CDS:2 [Diversispora eburnea]
MEFNCIAKIVFIQWLENTIDTDGLSSPKFKNNFSKILLFSLCAPLFTIESYTI